MSHQDPYPPAPPPGGAARGPAGAPAPSPPPRPAMVRTAVLLMWGGAVLSVVTALSSFLLVGDVRAMVDQELADRGLAGQPELPPEFVDASMTLGIVIGVVIGVVEAALWVLNAVFCGRGAQWSRILGTVLGGVFLLSSIASFLQPITTVSLVLQVVTVLLVATTIAMLWVPASQAWFRAVAASRRPGAPPPRPA